jgi:hypothetical protein
MLNKIISGGQTGADQAALDVAIRLGIPHGGWIPKGRRTEKGALPPKYLLQEMPDDNYAKRTEKNVIDSDGTIIFSHGKLTGGSELTRIVAEKYNRPHLHLDLNVRSEFQAAQMIKDWVVQHHIEVLNVAGPRESHDPNIYRATADILQTAFFLGIIDETLLNSFAPDAQQHPSLESGSLPRTVGEAVDSLMSKLTFKEKSKLANLPVSKLKDLRSSLGSNIQDDFKIGPENKELLASCRSVSYDDSLAAEEAAFLILKTLWEKLQKQTNLIKIVR